MKETGNESFLHGSDSRKAVMACATAVFLAFSYASKVAAQTWQKYNSSSNVSAVSGDRSAVPAGIANLNAKEINYKNYRDYVTQGNPYNDLSKVMLLYNVGTGKFLNIGGYWGTHAALSDVPRLFWLQRKNDKLASQYSYVRYTDEGETGVTDKYENPMKSFVKNTSLQVGSQYGDVRTNAVYNSVKVQKASSLGDGGNVLKPNVATQGRTFMKEYNGNLTDRVVVANVDLSTCKAGEEENILSIGTDIANANTGSNIHIYYNGTTLTAKSVAADGTEKSGTISVSGTANIVLHSNGLFVNGTSIDNIGGDNAVVKYLASDASKVQIGSVAGSVHSYATYNDITISNIDSKAVEDGHVGDGSKFVKYYPGALEDLTLEADIDLTNCKSAAWENVLSIGSNISNWDDNIHISYMPNSGCVTVIAGTTPGNEGNSIWWWSDGNKIHVKISKDGVSVYPVKAPTHSITIPATNAVVQKLLTAGGLQVGSMLETSDNSQTRSYATYENVTVSKTSGDFAAAELTATSNTVGGSEETVLFSDKSVSGAQVAESATANFANGDALLADIDLSKCATANENVLSIGTGISKWGYSEDLAQQADNLHIFYLGKEDGKHKLYVANANKYHDNDLKRIFYVEDGKTMLVKLNADGLYINGTQVYADTDPLPSFEGNKYPGEIVKFKLADADNKILALDSEGKYIVVEPTDADYDDAEGIKRYQNAYIYTVEERDEDNKVSMPYFISSVFKNTDTTTENEGNFLSWAPKATANAFGDIGVFGDRALPQNGLTVDEAVKCSEWYFEPTGEEGVYRIYLQMDNVDVQDRGTNGNYTTTTVSGTNKFYLQATAQTVFGNSLENYHTGDWSAVTASSLDGAEALSTLPSDTKNAEWKVFDLEEYNTLFNTEQSDMTSAVDVSYMISDPDFRRKNANITNWKMDSSLDSHVRIGYDQFSKKSPTDANYTSDDNKTTDSQQWSVLSNHEGNHGRYMGVDVNDASGKFYQDITIINSGWYSLRCGGITTVGSKLFVKLGDNDETATPLHALTSEEYDKLKRIDVAWPFSYINLGSAGNEAMPMYNAIVYMNDENLQTDNGDADTHKAFNNELKFYVDPDMLKAKGGSLTVRIGIDVAPATTEVQSADENSSKATAPASEFSNLKWTVFDNFKLLFSGNTGDPYLILDEDDTDLDYLDNGIHKYQSGVKDASGKTVHKKLMLHRTFSAGNWNTIMLPVGLTEEQFKQAFGDDATLAQLDKLTDTEIQFKTVYQASKYDNTQYGSYTDETEYWLKPMTPYIINTKKAQGDETDLYTAKLYTRSSNGTEYNEKSVGGDAGAYFMVDGISLIDGIVKNGTTADATFGTPYDFKGMTATIGDETYPYVMTGQVAEGNGTMTAYGHLAKNFTMTDGKRTLIDGRAPMADSYTLTKNTLTYLGGGAASKGFRCWFQYNEPSSEARPTLMLDGIQMTTGINDITCNDEGITPINVYANGIYTIEGQLVRRGSTSLDGLPKGIYIVGGRKTVKQ